MQAPFQPQRGKLQQKRAALEAVDISLQNLEDIQREELILQFKRKELELKTKLAKAHAEGLFYSEAESSQVGNYPEFHRVAKPEGNSAAFHADFAQPKWRSRYQRTHRPNSCDLPS